MSPRRPSGLAMLAAGAAAVVLAGGGAAAWVAASDDDGDSTPFANGVASAPERTESTPTVPAEPESQTTPTPTQPEQPPVEGDPAPPAKATPPVTKQKTTFPRERKQSQDDPSPRKFAVPPAREFSGTGNATLGTVNLRQPAVVKWRTHGRFELRFGREAFPIIAPSASGQLVVPPYNFERVRVIASGRWKISITPQK